MLAIMKYILLMDAHASDLAGNNIPDICVLLFLNPWISTGTAVFIQNPGYHILYFS
jgi:hypothetical protein